MMSAYLVGLHGLCGVVCLRGGSVVVGYDVM